MTEHHLAANFTVVNGKATFIPMFYGADPGVIGNGAYAGHDFLSHEGNRGLELINAMNNEQKKTAIAAEEVMFNKFGALAFRGLGTKDKPIKA